MLVSITIHLSTPHRVKPVKVSGNILNFPSSNYIYHDPLGEVLIIAPWNYPVNLLIAPYVGAIAGGNTAILKPSEMTPHVANIIAKLIPQYMDQRAVAVVNGDVKETTELLKHKYDLICYTGNGRVGSIVMSAASKYLTPVILELGGKTPTYVSDSANLDLSAKRIVWGKYLNAGQTCMAPDYLLVNRSIKEKFLQLVKHYIREFYGEDPQKSADYGRIVNGTHLKRLKALLDHIGTATIFTGGKVDSNDRYIEPTVLDNVQYKDKIMEDEIFGPIFPVITVDSKEEAVRYINSRDKPLAIYIYSSNNAEIEYMLQNSTSGAVGVNDSVMHFANPYLPYGGVGASGMVSIHGKHSFTSFSHQKSVLWKPSSSWTDIPARYPPATPGKKRMIERVLSLDKWFG
jgi:aldehyde dehydrogenase (NAD+)